QIFRKRRLTFAIQAGGRDIDRQQALANHLLRNGGLEFVVNQVNRVVSAVSEILHQAVGHLPRQRKVNFARQVQDCIHALNLAAAEEVGALAADEQEIHRLVLAAVVGVELVREAVDVVVKTARQTAVRGQHDQQSLLDLLVRAQQGMLNP